MHNDEMTDATKLAACPFCRGEAQIIPSVAPFKGTHFHVECEHCGAKQGKQSDEAEAIAAWNTRAALSPEAGLAEVERVALASAGEAIDAIKADFPEWQPNEAQLGFGLAVGKRAFIAAFIAALRAPTPADRAEKAEALLREAGERLADWQLEKPDPETLDLCQRIDAALSPKGDEA